MNLEKLKLLDELTRKRIAENDLLGACYAVGMNGKTIFENAIGLADPETNTPLTDRTILRLASMTKPITGIAVMYAAERGLLELDDRVSRFLPGFAEMKVAVTNENGEVVGERPAKHEITVRDLLNLSSGLGSGPVGDRAWQSYHVSDGDTLASVVPRFAHQTLDFEPRSTWAYSWTQSFDTAAYLLEVVTGVEFETYLLENILHPLGCFDTVFTLSDAQRARLAPLYDTTDGVLRRRDTGNRIFGSVPTTYHSAGAGMAGTLADYLRIAGMLAGGGTFDGVRILSEESVRTMRTISNETFSPALHTEGWGVCMRVIDHTAENQCLPQGCFGWSGAYGTHFFIDPATGLYAVYMKNLFNGGGAGAETAREFERVVMDAMG